MKLTSDGTIEYRNEHGQLHRDDGPAVICPSGRMEWGRHGVVGRDDGPAKILADGTQEWYQNGLLHNDDGPAIIWANGTEEWYIHGKKGRFDGPAKIYRVGDEYTWFHPEHEHGIRLTVGLVKISYKGYTRYSTEAWEFYFNEFRNDPAHKAIVDLWEQFKAQKGDYEKDN